MSDFTYVIPSPKLLEISQLEVLRYVIYIHAKVVGGLKVLEEPINSRCSMSF